MSKKFTYAKNWTITNLDGSMHTMGSQRYDIGIYVIYEPNRRQSSVAPSTMVRRQREVTKMFNNGMFKDLSFGPEITVHLVDGLWKEYNEYEEPQKDFVFPKSFTEDIMLYSPNIPQIQTKGKLAFSMYNYDFYVTSYFEDNRFHKEYSITELTSGARIDFIRYKTQLEAIEAGKKLLIEKGEKIVRQNIDNLITLHNERT